MTQRIYTDDQLTVTVLYRNHRGETAERRVVPEYLRFGTSEWHDGEQWFLECRDVDKGVRRSFAVRDILRWDGGRDSAIRWPTWIPVGERLPEPQQPVLFVAGGLQEWSGCTHYNGLVFGGKFIDELMGFSLPGMGLPATHWMPSPPPPPAPESA